MQKSIFCSSDIDKSRLQHGIESDDFAEIDIARLGFGIIPLDEILLKPAVVHKHHAALHQLAVENDLFC